MGNIVLLDELTINKIAAGEVIERPASVIKEMVENSIDAGANTVTIEIKNGGISYIRIADNGKGIARDDVELAFERHATSKIRSADDLQDIKSMGFRGEALASIAAISNVEIVTKTADEDIGTKAVVEGGDVLNIEDTACMQGTTITVRNLFYNTPVRYKFLKKDFTEAGYIEDVVTRIALIHPEIAIKLVNSGKTVVQTNGNGDLKTAVYSIYGKDISENTFPVSYEYEYIKITGLIGAPSIARSNRAYQMFFVNQRYIKDKTLSSAVEQAFKGMLPIGKFPFLVLNLEMNPNKVDVNVHPAKLEVRFEEESIAFKAMYHAIKDTLLKEDFISEREKNKQVKDASKDAFKIQNNIIEQIYNERNSLNNEKTSDVKNESVKGNETDVNIHGILGNTDIMQKLKALQEDLKREVEANPNLELTDKYKEMELKYNSIIESANTEDVISQEVQNQDENETIESAEDVNENEVDTKEDFTANYVEVKEETNNDVNEFENNNISEVPGNTIEESIENVDTIEHEVNQSTDNDKTGDEDNSVEQEGIEVSNNEYIESEEARKVEANNQNEPVEEEPQTENIDNYVEEEKNEEIQELDLQQQSEVEKLNITQTIPEENISENNNVKILSFEEMYKQLFGKEPYGGRREVEKVEEKEEEFDTFEEIKDNNISVFEGSEEYKKQAYKFLGIAFDTYILLEIDNELYIMDQHAAHERIMYERVKENFYSDEEKDCQMLLLPDIITLTHKEMDIAKDNIELFEKAGFMLEEFGENTIKLSGVPSVCIDLDTKELFMETLDEINTVARTAKQEREEKFIATIACKAAVKANMSLSEEEVNSLMSKLLELPNPFTCPHGRPTVIKMSKYEIERKFARK